MVTRPDGTLAAAVGTMGGDSQPQILLQVVCRWLRHGHSPGRSIAAPRFTLKGATGFDTWLTSDPTVQLESHAPPGWAEGLRERGHPVVVAPPEGAHGFGHAHLLARNPAGGWAGAADPRADIGSTAGY
jgi:gamma-glutamyltranspeptidase/glutathione hydrolase